MKDHELEENLRKLDLPDDLPEVLLANTGKQDQAVMERIKTRTMQRQTKKLRRFTVLKSLAAAAALLIVLLVTVGPVKVTAAVNYRSYAVDGK